MLTVTVADCTNAPCHENHVTSSFTMSYCRQYVPGAGGACTVALRFATVPPGATSLASSVRVPQIATGLPAAHAPLCQWYANRTGFVPPAFHVADPAFVNDTATSVVAPVFIVAGSVFAHHVTAYVGVLTITVCFGVVAPCHENHVTPSCTMSYCRQYVHAVGGAWIVALRFVTDAPGATSAGSNVRTP